MFKLMYVYGKAFHIYIPKTSEISENRGVIIPYNVHKEFVN